MSAHEQDCEIDLCGMVASETVEHPQRGDMDVCQTHAKRIRALPSWRFIGSQEVAQ